MIFVVKTRYLEMYLSYKMFTKVVLTNARHKKNLLNNAYFVYFFSTCI